MSFSAFLFAKDIKMLLPKNLENITKLGFSSIETNLEKKEKLINFINDSFEISDEIILPTQTTYYKIDHDKDINVAYTVNDSHYEDFVSFSSNLNTSINTGVYPNNNLIISDPMVFRGLLVREVTFIPYRIDFENQIVEIYDDVEIEVEEYITDEIRNYSQNKLSKLFEPLYEDMIINYVASDRDEDYQQPSVLYICGGSSLDNPYVQQLLEWRHKTGYIVNAVTTNEIGSSNANTIKNYLEDAYENWENPPEIVGLIGDTSGSYSIGYFTENWSGYNGEGDLPYSQLDGDDFLPEVFIGRLSVSSSSSLSNVINKTLIYERATYLSSDSDWYERAALCGDPSSSGWSTVISNEYVENILESYGFDDVHGNYGSGSYANWMENELEDGCLYMNYRGYWGASGFGSSQINSANNSYKTPFAVFITCGTGNFSGTSLSEDLYRAGSVSNPKGAVAAIGTATTGTHTLFNNIVDMGIFDGIFPKGITSAGGAMASGRLALFLTYPQNPNNAVGIFSHWTNLIGDPALELWTDTPEIMEVDFQNTIDWGTNFIDVHIIDQNGIGIQNANITLLKGDDEIFKTIQTNYLGEATIDLEYEEAGQVLLTVTKKNYKPIEESFFIVSDDMVVNVDSDNVTINDEDGEYTQGNDDDIINPGETVVVEIPLHNFGNETVFGLQATLSTDSDLVNIVNNVNQYGDLTVNQSSIGTAFYLVTFDNNITQETEFELRLNISDSNGNQWSSLIHLEKEAGNINFDHFDLIDNFELNPGEQVELRVYLENEGLQRVDDISFTLLPSGYLVDIMQDEVYLGSIEAGQTVNGAGILIYVNGNTINGSVLNMNANLSNSSGYNQNISFNVGVGHVTQDDPLGPDEHGYYIYDSGDLGYSLAPIYDWIEIDSDFGGDGIDLNLSDTGNGNNLTNNSAIVELPFPFTFYGVTYNEITVNTNGWISFGESLLESFRNYPIPGAGGPSPMLAAFWDDLKTSNGEIYVYSGGNYFIIEWSEMRTYHSNSEETFQIILYDNTYLTPTGDNEMKIQYKEFNNTSGSTNGSTHGQYSTIGLENMYSDIGLQYTFYNNYPTAAMPLHNESAIFVTTRNPVETLLGDANQDSEVNVLDIIVVVNHIINLELLSPMGVYISDMDGNANINILDVIQIINIILDNN